METHLKPKTGSKWIFTKDFYGVMLFTTKKGKVKKLILGQLIKVVSWDSSRVMVKMLICGPDKQGISVS